MEKSASFLFLTAKSLIVKKFVKDNVHHIVYENLNEFFTLTDGTKPPADKHRANKMKVKTLTSKDSWTYGDDETRGKFLDQRSSPDKGKDICADAVKTTMAEKEYKSLVKMALTYKKKLKFDDARGRLTVPKAIAGEDKYFAMRTNSSKPTVKIAINICGSACVQKEQFENVAKTAIPTIYALEAAGIPTEVYYCAFVDGCHETKEFKYTATHVKVKSAQERFNWTTFAPIFCLGSYREGMFNSWWASEYEANDGLGCPMDSSDIERKGNFGYTSVIGLNAAGPVDTVKTIFDNLKGARK